MTNLQLYLAIGVPVLVNAVMFGLLAAHIKARFDEMDRKFDDMLVVMDARLRRLGSP